jgi:hypothetical protein
MRAITWSWSNGQHPEAKIIISGDPDCSPHVMIAVTISPDS